MIYNLKFVTVKYDYLLYDFSLSVTDEMKNLLYFMYNLVITSTLHEIELLIEYKIEFSMEEFY